MKSAKQSRQITINNNNDFNAPRPWINRPLSSIKKNIQVLNSILYRRVGSVS